ncbi:MAG TPA: cellulase family glycosylhydrolase [Solirubrobacterales bacterium]
MAIAVAAAALAFVSAAAQAAPTAPLSHSGRWITDARGRVVILHGVNMVFKRPPYYPAATGFGRDDAAFLERHGFNAVRLGLIYKGVEPNPGAYDDGYLNRIAATESLLARHGVFSQLDFHQDMYNERFQGEGWPDWAVQDDGLPNQPQLGFPNNYFAMPALLRAFDHFWANDPGPGGVGLQDRYAAAWAHVAARFAKARHTLGFDLMNEPWPGTPWTTCFAAAGCPAFDAGTMAPFYHRVIDRIRAVERQKLIWYEPNVLFNFGAETNIPGLGDRSAGFTFHVYCTPGVAVVPYNTASCDALDDHVLSNADKRAQASGDALLLSEFGATDDLATIRLNVKLADHHMVGWQYWHYCECLDPTTSGSGTQAIVVDPSRPPAGYNVKRAKLDVLSEPYPQVVAGTPSAYGFDPATRRFSLSYSTRGPTGKSFARPPRKRAKHRRSRETQIFLGRNQYPGGYRVSVAAGAIASRPNARLLRVVACPHGRKVRVAVRPATRRSRSHVACSVPGQPGKHRRGG